MRGRDAETVRDLLETACAGEHPHDSLIEKATRLARRLEGRPRDDEELRRRRRMASKRTVAASMAVLCSLSAAHAAPRTYAQQACAEFRRDNPTYTMPLHVACIQAVPSLYGPRNHIETKTTDFYCPEVAGARKHTIVDVIDWPTDPRECNDPNAVMR